MSKRKKISHWYVIFITVILFVVLISFLTWQMLVGKDPALQGPFRKETKGSSGSNKRLKMAQATTSTGNQLHTISVAKPHLRQRVHAQRQLSVPARPVPSQPVPAPVVVPVTPVVTSSS